MAGNTLAGNSISPRKGDRLEWRSTMPLPRNLSVLETWGFGLTGHLSWLGTAPAMHNALGSNAIFVWLPGTIIGMLLNFQVQRLGREWPDMAGGTPNYAARLLKKYPILAGYGALSYFFSWIAAPAIFALILTDLIEANLETLGISCPETALNVGFTAIAFIVGFTGTRALSILHLCFVIPAVGFLLVFCTQGIGWLLLSPASPGFFPSSLPPFSFVDWAKWFFFAVFGAYACETASSFVADSHRPGETLRFLSFAAWLIPIVYLGGSWVLMRLATAPGLDDHTFLNLLAAAKPFWGSSAPFLVTLLIASSCLLYCATTVSNCPRILYQLAKDGHLSPVFTVVSRREVFGPGLVFTFLLSLACLAWGDVESLVMVSATGFVTGMMSVHLGLWLNRGNPEARWPWQSLGFFLLEAIALVVGGLAWDRQNLAIGLLFPLGILAMDAAIRRIPFAPFHPGWWVQRYRRQSYSKIDDFVALQVGTLIFLLCSTAALAWGTKAKLDGFPSHTGDNLLVILVITVAFVGVAIACWTSLPQVAALAEARQQAERRFITALDTAVDGVLVLDESGAITQANPAAVEILGRKTFDLIGHRLNELLPELLGEPVQWPQRSEYAISQGDSRTLETTLSERSQADFREYIVILRDITERKRSEEALQRSEAQFRALAAQEELLNRLANQIRNSLELETILDTALKEIYSLLAIDLSTFSWYHPDVDPPSWEVVKEVKKDHLPTWVGQLHSDAAYRPYTEKILRRQIVRVDDARTLEGDPALQQLLVATDCASALGLPIHTPSGRIGMVSCSRFHDAKPWKESELTLIEAIANQLAIAINQAELYAEACSSARVATDQALQLEKALQELQQTQTQLIQTEKMSSLGQLVAGVAHEINNPVNFIYGNITYLDEYTQNLLALIHLYQKRYPNPDAEIEALLEENDLDFLIEDLPKTLSSMKVGAQRIREIVSTLRNFSRLDEAEMKPVDIHDGIDSTLLILQNSLKEKPDAPGIKIVKEYGDLPKVECYAGQLNQVFMNILNNAIDALHLRDKDRSSQEIKEHPSMITIRTQILNNNRVGISIKDNGLGMTSNVISQIFNPFFTTKPVGKGTGLGLSISYQIIVDKHGGHLECKSQANEGAEFWIEIPLQPIRKMN